MAIRSGLLELLAFLQRQEEGICGMCAAAPETFDKPSPLIPRGALKKAMLAARPRS